MTSKRKDFDLIIVLNEFKSCLDGSQSVLMGHYIQAYTELCRFVRLLGSAFGFVAKDVESKLHILQSHLESDAHEHYSSVKNMIEYEIQKNIIKRKTDTRSGCLTLLRLHRALDFILQFLQQIASSDETANMPELAATVYGDTLANYHPWVVKKMAYMAMYTLPKKNNLMETICKHPLEETSACINQTVQAGKPVYDRIQELYEQNHLLHLA